MRVTGGSLTGFKIAAPKGRRVRPTSDMVREALFDLLGPRVRGSRFWDLYAGTGAVGIEALSRGAALALFVEESPVCCRIIKGNLQRMGLEESALVVKSDALRAVKRLCDGMQRADIVFLDPPYGSGIQATLREAAAMMIAAGTIDSEALMVCQHSKREEVPERAAELSLQRQQRYGDTVLSFFWMGHA